MGWEPFQLFQIGLWRITWVFRLRGHPQTIRRPLLALNTECYNQTSRAKTSCHQEKAVGKGGGRPCRSLRWMSCLKAAIAEACRSGSLAGPDLIRGPPAWAQLWRMVTTGGISCGNATAQRASGFKTSCKNGAHPATLLRTWDTCATTCCAALRLWGSAEWEQTMCEVRITANTWHCCDDCCISSPTNSRHWTILGTPSTIIGTKEGS